MTIVKSCTLTNKYKCLTDLKGEDMTDVPHVDALFSKAYENTWVKVTNMYSECYNNNKFLFHYTSLEGLTGILNSQELWLTDLRFMNDNQELEFAGGALPAIRETCDTKISKTISDVINNINRGFTSRIFGMSFCEDGDLLSQWRGYGSGSGVAIGFKRSDLESFLPAKCYKVLYGFSHAHEILKILFSEYWSQELHVESDAHALWNFRNSLTSAVLDIYPEIASTIKNHNFSEEQEWRLIKKQTFSHNAAGQNEVRYRVKGCIIVPYVSISLRPKKLPIHNIIVGPSRYADRIQEVILDMMRKHGYHSRVRLSDVPYVSG